MTCAVRVFAATQFTGLRCFAPETRHPGVTSELFDSNILSASQHTAEYHFLWFLLWRPRPRVPHVFRNSVPHGVRVPKN